jgi:hypothetical protein
MRPLRCPSKSNAGRPQSAAERMFQIVYANIPKSPRHWFAVLLALEIDSQIGRILLNADAVVDIKLSLEILRFVLTQKSFHDTQILLVLSALTPNIWTINSLSADSWLIGSLFKMTVARECRDSNCNFRITDFSEAMV